MEDFSCTLAKYRKRQATILQVIVVLYVIVFMISVHNSVGKDTKNVVRVHRNLTKGQTIFAFICGISSCITVFVGLATYCYLPKMRNNIHGKMRMCFMCSQVVISLSNPVMAVVDNFHFVSSDNPLMDAIALQLPRISSIVYCFWLTVMGFLTWTTFSKPLQASGAPQEKNQLLYCCLFAWGFPFALFILQQVCFFCFDFQILNALTITWMFTVPINIVMIVSTIINLNLHRSAKNSDQGKKVATEDIIMYIKLASITGIDWSILCFAMIARSKLIMFIGYSILLLQGVCQFTLFILNKRVLLMFREKRSGNRSVVC